MFKVHQPMVSMHAVQSVSDSVASRKMLQTMGLTLNAWVDGEFWHGTWEGDDSDIRRIDPVSSAVLERLEMPSGTGVSGLESDGADLFYAGGGGSGKVRAVRRTPN